MRRKEEPENREGYIDTPFYLYNDPHSTLSVKNEPKLQMFKTE